MFGPYLSIQRLAHTHTQVLNVAALFADFPEQGMCAPAAPALDKQGKPSANLVPLCTTVSTLRITDAAD